MNKKRSRVIIVLILALVLVFSSCTNNTKQETDKPMQTETKSTETKSTEKETTEEEIINFNATGYPIVNEKITLRVLLNNVPSSPSDYNDTAVMQKAEEITNIHIEWIMPGAGFQEKKNLMLATGDLPDFFFTHLSAGDLAKYGGEGSLIPMRERIREYAPNVERLFDAIPGLEGFSIAPDGNMYGVPRINGGPWMKTAGIPMINQKWLDNLGLDMPTNIDEFADVMRKFKTEDPNQNGEADEIPISLEGGFFGRNGLTNLMYPFGVALAGDVLDVKDGKVYLAVTSDAFKEGIEWIAGLSAEGLIDKEGFTLNRDQRLAKVSNEPFVAGYVQDWALSIAFSNSNANEEYVYMPMIKGPDGRDPVFYYIELSGIMRGAGAITKANENPEATMRWIDYCYEERNSFEMCEGDIGVRLIEQEDGTLLVGPPPEGMASSDHRHSLVPGARGLWAVLPEGYETLRVPSADDRTQYVTDHKAYADPEILPNLFYTVEESEQIAVLKIQINDYINLTLSQWIVEGQVENWEDFVTELDKMGLQEYLTLIQAAYDRFLG